MNPLLKTFAPMALLAAGCSNTVAALDLESAETTIDQVATAALADKVHHFVPAGDLDGDGKPDFAVVTQTAVELLYGGPLPTEYAPHATLSVFAAPDTSRPEVVAVGDLDGDDRSDLVVVRQHDCKITATNPVYTGTRKSSAFVLYGGPRRSGTQDIAAAAIELAEPGDCVGLYPEAVDDLDGDSFDELVVVRRGGRDGAGTASISYGGAARLSNRSLAALGTHVQDSKNFELSLYPLGDFDGDGRGDLGFVQIIVNPDPAEDEEESADVFGVLWGGARMTGQVTLGALPVLYRNEGAVPLHRVGDLDSDGREDYRVYGGLLIYGRGRAAIGGDLLAMAGAELSSLNGYDEVYGAAISGDVDGDGKLDLVTAMGAIDYSAVKRIPPRIGVVPSAKLRGPASFVDHAPALIGRVTEESVEGQPYLQREELMPIAVMDFDGDGRKELWVAGRHAYVIEY